jgi:hypothetical protein
MSSDQGRICVERNLAAVRRRSEGSPTESNQARIRHAIWLSYTEAIMLHIVPAGSDFVRVARNTPEASQKDFGPEPSGGEVKFSVGRDSPKIPSRLTIDGHSAQFPAPAPPQSASMQPGPGRRP